MRFLPAFDAIVLAHDDRRRVMTDAVRAAVCDGAAVAATVLVDGTVAGTWQASREGDTAVVTVTLLRPLNAPERAAVEDEGAALVRFLHPQAAAADVRVAAAADGDGRRTR